MMVRQLRINEVAFMLFICVFYTNGKCSSISGSDSIVFFPGTFSELLVKAKNSNKPIYIDVYTDWCAPCKKMAKQVFNNSEVSVFFNKNFLNYRINAEKGEGKLLAKTYAVVAYPTSIYMDSSGELLKRVEGYSTVENFMIGAREVQSTSTNYYTLAALDDKYNNGERETSFLNTYLKKLSIYKKKREDILIDYISRFPKEAWFARENLQLIINHIETFDNVVYEHITNKISTIRDNNKELQDLYIAYRVMQFEIIEKNFSKAVQRKSEVLANKCIQARYHLYTTMTNQTPVDSLEFINDLRIRYYYKSKQMDIYTPMVVKEIYRLMQISVDSIKKHDNKTYENFLLKTSKIEDSVKRSHIIKTEDNRMKSLESDRIAKKLSDYAKTFCEDVDDPALLQNALAWCQRSNEYRKDKKPIEISAAILTKLGEKDKAITLLQKEIDMDKNPTEIAEHLERIIEVYKSRNEQEVNSSN